MKRMTKTEMNQFITANKKTFKQGNTIPAYDLCDWFSISKPITTRVSSAVTSANIQRHNLQKLSAYTSLNRILATRGICLKSTNYGQAYEVLDADATETKVSRLHSTASSKAVAAMNLAAGIKEGRGKWRKLTRKQLETVRDTHV